MNLGKKRRFTIDGLWNRFLDILYPPFCVVCGVDGLWVCSSCTLVVKFFVRQACPFCLRVETGGLICERCKIIFANGLTGLFACVEYRENMIESKLIHALKYDFITDLVPSIGDIMLKALDGGFPDGWVLSFVPLHVKRQKWRGFNQAELLAKYLGEKMELPVVNLLERISFSKAQMELGREERAENIRGAFAPRISHDEFHPIKIPKKIILIDDVATTLSTLNECAQVLKNAGVAEVFGLVFARAV